MATLLMRFSTKLTAIGADLIVIGRKKFHFHGSGDVYSYQEYAPSDYREALIRLRNRTRSAKQAQLTIDYYNEVKS